MEIHIPPYISFTMQQIELANHTSFCVGGAIRDALRGKEPHDWDLTTTALPDEVLNIFSNQKTLQHGLRHGTVTVILENQPIEITTMRQDGIYENFRKPKQVTFSTNIYEDLARRDFTINAMAYNPKQGLLDPYNGQEDIRNHTIRCVGKPTVRFNEDALRILRALRFASILGYDIEESTSQAIFSSKENLREIAKERIIAEWNQLLLGKFAANILPFYADVFGVFLDSVPPEYFAKWASKLENTPPNLTLRWAVAFLLFPDKKQEEIAAQQLTALPLPKQLLQDVLFLIKQAKTPLPVTKPAIKQLLFSMGENRFFLWLALQKSQKNIDTEKIENQAKIIIKSECLSLKDLDIRGDDLLSAGFHASKELGLVLSQLLKLVITDQIPNQREKLLAQAKLLYNNQPNTTL